jgi:Ca2+-binding EF-hand superfamily protein
LPADAREARFMTKAVFTTGFLVSALLLGGVGTAHAQQPARWKPDTNGDDRLSKSEFVDQAERRFVRFDTNADGIIDKAEIDAAAATAAARAKLRIERMMTRLDTDGDGKVLRAESVQRASERFARLDVDGDGLLKREDLRRKGPATRNQNSREVPN